MLSAPRVGGSHRLAGLLIAAALVVDAGAAVVVLRPGAEVPVSAAPRLVAPSPRVLGDRVDHEREERTREVSTLLVGRAAALLHRDRAAFLAGLDPTETEFVRRQTSMFDALAGIPLATWTYHLDADHEISPQSSYLSHYTSEVWAPQVTLYYQLAGFDPEPTQLAMHYTFIRRGDAWLLADDADFAGVTDLQTARDIWDFGALDIVRADNVLVVGHPGRHAQLAQIANEAAAAVPAVRDAVGASWAQRVVILAPSSIGEVTELIGRGTDLSQIAAVAIAQVSADNGRYHAVGNRVVVNPVNYARLTRVGKRIVLRHEITHVATRSVTGESSPTWLVEGLADYVGYLNSGVSTRVAAKELRQDVRAGRMPKTLPTNDDFDGSSGKLSQAYEGAWLACRLIAERLGEKALIEFYRRVGSTPGASDVVLRNAFRDVLHTSLPAFTEAWQSYLRAQLG